MEQDRTQRPEADDPGAAPHRDAQGAGPPHPAGERKANPDERHGGGGGGGGGREAFGRCEEESRPDTLPHDLPKTDKWKLVVGAIVLAVLFVALFLLGYIPRRAAQRKVEARSHEVATAKLIVDVTQPRRTSAAAMLDLPGDALPLQQTSLYPRTNGYLQKLYVDIGDHVKDGQLLAEISTPEIDAQLEAARASLLQAQANLIRTEHDYDLADTTLRRYKGLFQTGGVTQQQLDERQNTYDQAKANLEAAKAAVATARAQVQQLAALQGFERVYAPFNGVITARGFDLGALLSSNGTTQLFQVDRTDVLRVFVNVPQVYATAIKTGHPAQYFVRNYPGTPFAGRVTRTTGALDPRTRTLKMEVDFENGGGLLLAGMYGQVHLEIPRSTPAIVIPTSSLVFNADGLRVATVGRDKRVHFKTIDVGRDYGTEIEVAHGLRGDEAIVANPGERLADGLEVDTAQAPGGGGGGGEQREDNNQNRPPAKDTRQASVK